MSRPADLPFARVNYSTSLSEKSTRCEIVVDGNPVAILPISSIEFTHEHPNGIPRVKLGLLGDTIDLQTHIPTRST